MEQKLQSDEKKLAIEYVATELLRPYEENPRKWSVEARDQLKKSLSMYGALDPLLVNRASGRENVVLGGNFRLEMAKELGITELPVVFVEISDRAIERDLVVRINKAVGEFDYEKLIAFTEDFLKDVGFSSIEIDQIFDIDESPELFDLDKELKKVGITEVTIQKGDIWLVGDAKLMVGDSTIAEDMVALMDGEQADLCLTDPPYILDYLGAKRKGEAVTGFGAKKNRRYLETDSLPDNFTELWMANVAAVAKPDFSIIVYENWKNLRVIWAEMEKYFKVKNMIVWHLPNRHQGFSSKYKFFSKHDIAMVGASGDVPYNHDSEPDGLQEEYESALYAISGKPHWEGYEHGKRVQPTDFIEYQASDEKSTGQGIIFGTKPIEILIPYIKVLTKRGDLVLEPFCGSGSTGVASLKMGRRCFLMEKSPVYAAVALKRLEKVSGKKAVLISQGNGLSGKESDAEK